MAANGATHRLLTRVVRSLRAADKKEQVQGFRGREAWLSPDVADALTWMVRTSPTNTRAHWQDELGLFLCRLRLRVLSRHARCAWNRGQKTRPSCQPRLFFLSDSLFLGWCVLAGHVRQPSVDRGVLLLQPTTRVRHASTIGLCCKENQKGKGN